MKINMKLRLQNKQFIVGLVSALLLLAGQIAQLLGYNIDEAVSSGVMDVVNTVLAILVSIGVVQDPTTKGLSDDEEVMKTDSL